MSEIVRAVDLDECLVGFIHPFLRFMQHEYRIDIKYNQIKDFDLTKCGVGRTGEEVGERISQFFASEYAERIRLLTGAKEVINRWKREGEVYFITSRVGEQVQHHTKEFLEKKFGRLNGNLIFSSESNRKGDICEKLGVLMIVEDCPRYINELLHKGIEVAVYNRPWNQWISGPRVRRVNNWREIDVLTGGKR